MWDSKKNRSQPLDWFLIESEHKSLRISDFCNVFSFVETSDIRHFQLSVCWFSVGHAASAVDWIKFQCVVFLRLNLSRMPAIKKAKADNGRTEICWFLKFHKQCQNCRVLIYANSRETLFRNKIFQKYYSAYLARRSSQSLGLLITSSCSMLWHLQQMRSVSNLFIYFSSHHLFKCFRLDASQA